MRNLQETSLRHVLPCPPVYVVCTCRLSAQHPWFLVAGIACLFLTAPYVPWSWFSIMSTDDFYKEEDTKQFSGIPNH